MDIRQKKYELIEQLTRITDVKLLNEIDALLENWQAAENTASLERGYQQSEEGLGRDNTIVLNELREKYSKNEGDLDT